MHHSLAQRILFHQRNTWFSSFERVVTVHCWAALNLGAGVEQPFDCLVAQNRHAGQSMGSSMDWTLEDNMVVGQFFHATHRPQRRPYHLCKQERKRSTPVRRRLNRTLFLGGSFQEGGCRCRGWKCGVLHGCPTTPHFIGDPPSAPHVCYCYCEMKWWVVARRVQMGVSIWDFETPYIIHLHSVNRWALSGADDQAPWHGMLETVSFLWDEAQQVGCLQG